MVTFFLQSFALVAALSTAAPTPEAAGTALLHAWQLEDAQALAQKALWAQPQDAAMQRLAADVLYHQGEHLAAWSLLPPSQKMPPRFATDLTARIARTARQAQGMVEHTTPHFVLHARGKDAVLFAWAEPILERAYAELTRALAFDQATEDTRIAVEFYPTAAALSDVTGLTLAEIERTGTIAVCKYHRLMILTPRATLGGYAWADTLAHELIHLIVSKKTFDRAPVWLQEGLAKFYESQWQGPKPFSLGRDLAEELARAKRDQHLVPFARMHPSMAKLGSQQEAALAFAQVSSLLAYIVSEFGPSAPASLLGALREGDSLELAFRRICKQPLAQIEQKWRKSLPPPALIPPVRPLPRRIALETASTQPQKHDAPTARDAPHGRDRKTQDAARLGELMLLRGHAAEAAHYYKRAVTESQMQDSALIVSLVRAQRAANLSQIADETLGRGLLMHPDGGDLRLLRAERDVEEKNWHAVLEHTERAAHLNPFNPTLYIWREAAFTALGDAAGAHAMHAQLGRVRLPAAPKAPPLPARAAPGATASFLTERWGPFCLDGELEKTPAYRKPLSMGTHRTSLLFPCQKEAGERFSIPLRTPEAPLLLMR